MRHTRLIILSLVVLLASTLQAQTDHYIGFSLFGGMNSWLTQGTEQKTLQGAGGALDLTYNLRHKHLLFQVGVGVGLNGNRTDVGETSYTLSNQTDRNGHQLDYIYSFPQRSDRYTYMSLEVPLMIGAEFSGFYFLVGARGSMNLWGQTSAQAQVETIGDYSATFLDLFVNMPEWQFYPLTPIESGKQPFATRPNVAVVAEVGYEIQSSLRIAAFASYGLMSSYQPQASPLYTYARTYSETTNMLESIAMNHVLSTLPTSAKLNQLQAGIRVSYLLHVGTSRAKNKRHHGPCRCYLW